jgi:hypothetical protein
MRTAIKGGLGARAEVVRGGITSVSLTPEIGRTVGLMLHGSPDAGWTTNSCLQLPAAQLRAAAAQPDLKCRAPVIEAVRFRVPGRIDVALRRLDDPVTSVRVEWGDGAVSTRRLRSGPSRRTVILRHEFAQPGRHRVKVSVAATPVLACGSFAERAQAPPMVVRT